MAQLSSFYKTLFSSVKDCYEENLYCDVKLFGCAVEEEANNEDDNEADGSYPDPANMKSVQCHSLVLCSVAPTFKVKRQFFNILQSFKIRKLLNFHHLIFFSFFSGCFT